MRYYLAGELKSYLDNLLLAGQNEDGDLEWIGNRYEWENQEAEELLNNA